MPTALFPGCSYRLSVDWGIVHSCFYTQVAGVQVLARIYLFGVIQNAPPLSNDSNTHRLFLTKVYADFDCDVHFPDLAPYGLPLNSADTSLQGLKTDLLLVKVEDTDVEVLYYLLFSE